MPKKQPVNAFYFFMLDFKNEQRLKGNVLKNMAEVAAAAGPVWRDAPPSIRKKYEDLAQKEKAKNNIPEKKFTTTGIPFSEIERQEQDLKLLTENEKKDVRNLVKLKSFDNSILTEDIYIMDVNIYCQISDNYVIGESTILRFNIQDGIKDNYHEIVNPGVIPTGYALDMKLASQELGLDMPDTTDNKSNYMQILANMIDYLKKQDVNVKTLPPIFTMPDKVAPVSNFIQQLCNCSAEDASIFRVYKLDYFFFTLINAIKNSSSEGFPKESLALLALKKDAFKYALQLACEHHEPLEDKEIECTLSRCKRWAYSILDYACAVTGTTAVAGRHIPNNFHLDSILAYKEQKKEQPGPSVAGIHDDSESSCSSVTEFPPYDPKPNAWGRERVRPPVINYSKLTTRQAPELTETDFPSLSAASRGRGRGIVKGMSNLKLDK